MMAKIYGYDSPEEMIRSVTDISRQIYADPVDRQEFQRILAERGTVLDYIGKNLDKNGNIIWTQTTALAIKDNQGKICRYEGFISDINQRIQAEEHLQGVIQTLRDSEERWHMLFENAPDPIYIRVGANFSYVNTAAVDLFGAESAEKLLETPVLDRIHMGYKDLVTERMHQMDQGRNKTLPMEQVFLRMDSTPVTVEVSTVPIQYEGQDGVLVFVRDISERKMAEGVLSAARWRLESIIDGTHAGTWEWNIQTGETVFNEVWAQIVGYTLDELAPISIKTWEMMAHPDDLKQSEEFLERHFSGEVPYYDYESRMKHKDGSWVWVHDRGRVITRTDDGKPLMMFGTHSDITERKKNEELLKVSEERYRLLANNIPDIIYSLDGNGNIVTINSSAFEQYGYREQDSLGKPFLTFIHPEDRERVINSFRTAMEDKRKLTLGLQFRIVAEDGSDYWFDLSSHARFDNEGQYLGEDGVLRDITERKAIQEQLLASEKLAGIGTLAAGMAHELNSPLQIITGLSESAAARVRENKAEPDRLLRNLESIQQSGWRCAEIVRSLMAYARPSTGDIFPEDLNSLIKDTLLLVEHQIKVGANVRIRTELVDELPKLPCNNAEVSRALINLLTNACDALPKGGEIIIRSGYDSPSKRIWLQVEDDGPTISAEQRKRLFDPFFTTKAPGKGVGLGLPIVSSIVRSHNGEIKVEDREPHGAVFTLYFPEEGLLPRAADTEHSPGVGRYDRNII